MLVLRAAPAAQFHKLRRAAAPRFPVVHARDWDDALATIRTRPVELAAVDPQLEGSPSAREIERLRVLFPSLPLILYTALTPATAPVLLALGHSGINAVVFTRIDDHPARLRAVLAHEEARSASRQLLDQLAAVLAPLPSELRWVVEEVLRAPAELQTVQQVAARARVDRRTFERWFARLRLPSPRHFLAAAAGAARTSARDRKSTRLNSSHGYISYAVFCLKKKSNESRPAVQTLFVGLVLFLAILLLTTIGSASRVSPSPAPPGFAIHSILAPTLAIGELLA